MLSSGGIGKKVSHFLSTGNIISSTGLDLMQVSGYTIVAEKLNFLRFCAHFRSVHRGSFVSAFRAMIRVVHSRIHLILIFAFISSILVYGDEDHSCSKVTARSVGIFVPSAYTRWW